MKKILKIKAKIKAKNPTDLPDWGQGLGIIISQEIKFETDGLDPIQIAHAIDNVYQSLIKDSIELVVEEMN
jgi:hypothetical protein